jgi:hypothetical protein
MSINHIEVSIAAARIRYEVAANTPLKKLARDASDLAAAGHLNSFEDALRLYTVTKVSVVASLIRLFGKERSWTPEFVSCVVKALINATDEHEEFKALWDAKLFAD